MLCSSTLTNFMRNAAYGGEEEREGFHSKLARLLVPRHGGSFVEGFLNKGKHKPDIG